MADKSAIEWTDATWNPITGCSKISAGCAHCYAESVDRRFAERWKHEFKPWTAANAAYNVRLHPDRLDQPIRWRKPRKIFVNSMSDLFHEQVPDEFIWRVIAVMAEANWHTFQILTKRPRRMLEVVNKLASDFDGAVFNGHKVTWPLPNVWLGVSVEDQQAADERIPLLLQTPTTVRFLSCEPLLGLVDLGEWIGTYYCSSCGYRGLDGGAPDAEEGDDRCPCCGADSWYFTHAESHGGLDDETRSPISWIIAGGESGRVARPMHPVWARSLRDQCVSAGVPFMFKQWGQFSPEYDGLTAYTNVHSGITMDAPTPMYRIGKKRAGRELDGRMWDEMPAVTR